MYDIKSLISVLPKISNFGFRAAKSALSKAKGEADYDGTFSFIGGKMETTDESILTGMEREKNEEIGKEARILVYPTETHNLLFKKSDGNSMILPHIAGIYRAGEIKLNDEYSEYRWVPLVNLKDFEPKNESVFELTQWAASKLKDIKYDDLVEI